LSGNEQVLFVVSLQELSNSGQTVVVWFASVLERMRDLGERSQKTIL